MTCFYNLIIVSSLAFVPAIQADSDLLTIDTVLGQSKIRVIAPKIWSKKVLVFAHGLRPESMPLTADVSPDAIFEKSLLDSGWIVAATSYRRNGLIIKDAIYDIDSLRQYIVNRFGTPNYVLCMAIQWGEK
jgi:hypothetical protein